MFNHRIAAIALLVLGTAAAARANDTIAVMDFTASGASASEAAAVSSFVRNAVVRSGTYTVVDKKNMDKILQEQAFQQTGCTSQDCAVKLGKLLNVKKMVVGEYTMLGGVRFLTASLVDVESSKIERSGKVKGFEVGNADEAADQLVAQLEGKAVPPSQTQQTQQTQTVTPQWEQPAQPAWTPAPAAPRTPSKGYFLLYLGGSSGKITSYQGESTYTWASGFNEDEKLFSFEIGDIVAEGDGPALGMRIGIQTGGFAFDVELSKSSIITPAQTVEWYDSITPSYGSTYSQNTNRNLSEGFLIINSIAFMMNIYGVINSSGAFQPYIGAGFGFAYAGVQSESPTLSTGTELDESTMAFGLQVPLGFRIWASPKFCFWVEYHPSWFLIPGKITTGSGTNESEDTFNYQINQFLGGIGFGF